MTHENRRACLFKGTVGRGPNKSDRSLSDARIISLDNSTSESDSLPVATASDFHLEFFYSRRLTSIIVANDGDRRRRRGNLKRVAANGRVRTCKREIFTLAIESAPTPLHARTKSELEGQY